MAPERLVAVSTAAFDGYPMERAIEGIAGAGARAVEPAFIAGYVEFDETAFSEANAERIAALISAAGMVPAAVSAHLDLSTEGAAEKLGSRLRFAAALGASVLITNAGPAGRRAAILRSIEAALPACEALGVTLALENPGHGRGDLIATAEDGAAVLDAVGHPSLQLNYDVGNALTYHEGEAPRGADDRGAHLGRMVQLHLKDVARSAEGWTFTALGDGIVDFRALWNTIPRDMPVTIELPLRLDRPTGGAPKRRGAAVDLAAIDRAIRRSLGFVERLEAQSAPA